jgi:hypothetical protein
MPQVIKLWLRKSPHPPIQVSICRMDGPLSLQSTTPSPFTDHPWNPLTAMVLMGQTLIGNCPLPSLKNLNAKWSHLMIVMRMMILVMKMVRMEMILQTYNVEGANSRMTKLTKL